MPMNQELEKETPYIVIELIEYVRNGIVSKTIVNRTTGSITVSSIDAGEELILKTQPFDTFIQVIDGEAEVRINNKKFNLRLGEGIIVPAHASQRFNASEKFKMIATTIKSGYED